MQFHISFFFFLKKRALTKDTDRFRVIFTENRVYVYIYSKESFQESF